MLNLMSQEIKNKLNLNMKHSPGTVMGVTGSSKCDGICEGLDGTGVKMFTLDGKSFCKARFVVGPTGQSDCILGMPFFVENRAEVKYVVGKGTLVSFETKRCDIKEDKKSNKTRRVTTIATEEVDVRRGYDWPGVISSSSSSTHIIESHHLSIKPNHQQVLIPPRPVINPISVLQEQRALNRSSRILTSSNWRNHFKMDQIDRVPLYPSIHRSRTQSLSSSNELHPHLPKLVPRISLDQHLKLKRGHQFDHNKYQYHHSNRYIHDHQHYIDQSYLPIS
ncbi:hypothetical protein CROQUDRAFT_107848 [Cronartium quercuum f. sp. fusiforme G11]|uniref:Uncharacterized protein n=1 Tax=Cronartium quercuum f. sp. fusiforme G11 TaxID=708437 RepID=A0A9P6TAQ0_9BASI|nr:hypothetical protein CROQUDRAFT_107848 [Cronartium quercuum f. sp. fusiforme G11]